MFSPTGRASRTGLTRRRAIERGLAGTTVLFAALPACRPGEPGAQTGATDKEVTLRLGVRATNQAGNPSWEELSRGVALFMSKYPKIKVEMDGEMNAQKFLTAHAAGAAWDVQDTCCDQIPLEARAGVLMKLDPFIKKHVKPEEQRDWIEWQYKYFNVDGAQYGIGKYMGTTALYYNKNWFREKGVPFPDESWDWEKYREAMMRLSEPHNQKWGIAYIHSADRRQAKVHQNGGNFVDPRDDMKSLLGTEPVIEAYQWIQDRVWKDNSAIRQDQRGDPPLGERILFTSSKVAMLEEGSWTLLPVLMEQTPGFDWDVAVMPRGPKQRDVLGTTDGWAMWGETKFPEQAWTLFIYFNSDDWYGIQSRRLQPARISWQDKWAQMIVEANPGLQGKNLRAFTDPIKQGYARPWEIHRYHQAVNQLINDAYNKSVRDNQAPIRDTHIALAREIDEIQRRECAADPNCKKK